MVYSLTVGLYTCMCQLVEGSALLGSWCKYYFPLSLRQEIGMVNVVLV